MNETNPAETCMGMDLMVLNTFGMYARACARLTLCCARNKPHTVVEFRHNNMIVRGTSIMGLLTLEGYQGSLIRVVARGPGARDVLANIAEIFNQGFEMLDGESRLSVPPSNTMMFPVPCLPSEEPESGVH